MTDFKMADNRKPFKPKKKKEIKYGSVRKLKDYSAYQTTRPDKVEEIKAVLASPNFRNNNARLVYLFRHCTSAEHGYTIREFATARFPNYMTEPDGEYLAFRAIRRMFNRFGHDVINHEVVLAAMLRKLKGDTVYRYYYYNIIDDEEARERRAALCSLGLDRGIQQNQDIAENPDIEKEHAKHFKEIEDKMTEATKLELKKGQQAKLDYDKEHKAHLPDARSEWGELFGDE